MFERTITGLDIGSYAIKAAELRSGLRQVEFVRFEEALLPVGAPIEEREAAVFSFLRESNISLDLVVTAFSSDQLTQRHLRFPFADRKRVAQAVPFELESELPIPLDGLILAHEQVLTSPQQTDVLAVLCPRSEMESYMNGLGQAGVEPRIVDVEGSSLANLSSCLELSNGTRLVLDLGHRKTTLTMLVDGKPAVLRAIPIAGLHLTQALSRDLSLDPEQAERHKHETGVFKPSERRPVGPNTGEALDRLAREIVRSVQSIASDSLQTLAPSEITLVGGTSLVPDLPEFLAERSGLPCQTLQVPNLRQELAAFSDAGPRFAQAAALALRGVASRRVTTVDLRQGKFAYEVDLSDLRRGIQASFALAAMALLLWIGGLWSELASIERRADALRSGVSSIYLQVFPDATDAPDPYRAFEARVRETRELAAHLGVTGTGRSGLDIMREISSRIPTSLGVSLTDLKVERNSVQARGFAKDFVSVDKMREELSAVDWFGDVRLSDVVTDARRGGKTFNLTIRLREVTS